MLTGEYDNGLYIKEQTIQRLGFNQSVNDKISAAGGISYLDPKTKINMILIIALTPCHLT